MTYREEQELTYKYLDKIEWDKFLKPWYEINDIMEEVSNFANENPDINLPEEFHGDIFNYMDNSDFINYLENERELCTTHEDIIVKNYIGKIYYNNIEDLKGKND